MANQLAAVTALYDIGRDKIDGRSAADYLGWLNATLRLPVQFTIFLDPALDRSAVHAKPGDVIMQVPRESFRPFRWRTEVERICRHSDKIRTRRDITFFLPEYGMMVNSKIYMLEEAARHSDANTLLWLDAGISRFFVEDLSGCRVDQDFAAELGRSPLAFTADPLLARDLRRQVPATKYVGTAVRLMFGGDIAVSARTVGDVAAAVTEMIELDWLPNGLWDNDQVVFGSLALRGEGVSIIHVSKQPACIMERLFGYPARAPRKRSTIAQRLRWHFDRREQAPGDAQQS